MDNNNNEHLENLSPEAIKQLYDDIIELPEDGEIFLSYCSKYCGGSCTYSTQ